MKTEDKVLISILVGWGAFCLFYLSLIGAVAYAVAHFLHKIW